MNMDLSFLTANRFWAIVLGAVVFYLQQKGWIGQPEMLLIETIAGGFVTIRTVDRFGEKSGTTTVLAAPVVPDTSPSPGQ